MDRNEALKVLSGLAFSSALPRPFRISSSQQGTRSAVVNVRDVGAAGDGRTDDTTAFETAASTVGQRGGGVIYTPPGKYVVRDVWLRSNTWLRGEGAGRSVLLRKASSVSTLDPRSNVINAGPTSGALYPRSDPGRDIWISDIEVDANAQQQIQTWGGNAAGDSIGGAGIDVRWVKDVVLERVYAHHAITEGIRLWMCPSAKLIACRSAYNGTQERYSGRGNGFNVEGDADQTADPEFRKYTVLMDCEANHNADEGFEADLVTDLVFMGCVAHNNGNSSASPSSAYGFEFTGGRAGLTYPARVLVLGCMAQHNVRAGKTNNAGLMVNAASALQQLVVDDFIVYDQTGGAVALEIKGGMGDLILNNILVDGWGAPNSEQHAVIVQVASGATLRNVFLSNVCVRNGRAGGYHGITILTTGSPAGTCTNVRLSSCAVDDAPACGIGLLGNVSAFTIRDCAASNCKDHGIYVYSNGANNVLRDGFITGCLTEDNGGAGVMIGSPKGGYGRIEGVSVADCVTRNNTHGVHIGSIAADVDVGAVRFADNHGGDVIDEGQRTSLLRRPR